jgi:hypothetical protein
MEHPEPREFRTFSLRVRPGERTREGKIRTAKGSPMIMASASVDLFAELGRLKDGHAVPYEHSRKLAWDWMLTYPMNNNRWIAYFEDVPHDADNTNHAREDAFRSLNHATCFGGDGGYIGRIRRLKSGEARIVG